MSETTTPQPGNGSATLTATAQPAPLPDELLAKVIAESERCSPRDRPAPRRFT